MFYRLFALMSVSILLGTAAVAATLPGDPDSWTEYATAAEAEAGGWVRECSMSQAITVSSDCVTGAWSAGCRATQARWCDEFGLEKVVPLTGISSLHFCHRADWSGWNFVVRLYMQPTADEAAAGVEVKRLSWTFQSATTWTEHSFAVADGEWSWRVNNMWQLSGYEQTLTEMISIKWFFCTYWGVAVGDEMLIDDLYLVGDASSVPPAGSGARFAAPRPNPFNPRTELGFTLEEAAYLSLTIYDLTGRRQRRLAAAEFTAGVHAVTWNGRDDGGRVLPAGSYLACLEGDDIRLVRKLVMLK